MIIIKEEAELLGWVKAKDIIRNYRFTNDWVTDFYSLTRKLEKYYRDEVELFNDNVQNKINKEVIQYLLKNYPECQEDIMDEFNIFVKEDVIPFESKRNSKCPYWYIFKHGVGPGTVPDDVKIGKVKDIDNYYSIVWIDRPLSTDELKYYDIYPETMNMSILKNRLGYTQSEIDNLLDEKPVRSIRNNNVINAFDENLKKEYVYDDEEELDDGDIVYEARAYYGKNFSGLAHSEDFANEYELNEWIWGMCQQGYFVEVRDLEDGSWTRYAWLNDDGTGTFEPMSVDDLIIWTNA